MTTDPARRAALLRRSAPKVTEAAPDDAELLVLLEAAERVADHAGLRPWRTIALRGDARRRLGAALVEASGLDGAAADKLAAKPLRAPLLIALVVRRTWHPKAADWEQDAAAAGVAHMLSLLLDEAGWGVMWRTGPYTRHPAVADMHGLAPNEQLLGWLYVGGRDGERAPRGPVRPPQFSSID
ncbi:nitroreductase family protein [Agromyces sp. H3Y2-19a]|uniref:nitroreductase family protein n=1 Tax=Agromyces chromiiresistens TaxID=3030835 RepID=UPI0023B963B2|nr:nitroreductase family protein [Agromyces chromiiresistens]MDF0512786.1 nitroreductase family protein [Agromyces chromiiresistens]